MIVLNLVQQRHVSIKHKCLFGLQVIAYDTDFRTNGSFPSINQSFGGHGRYLLGSEFGILYANILSRQNMIDEHLKINQNLLLQLTK